MMNKAEKIRKLIVFGLISVLMVSAFFVRLDNFKNSRSRSIDEVVYYRMAKQMLVDPFEYNTIAYGAELAAGGRELPEYFFKKLYKHPPLFSISSVVSMKFFGPSMEAAFYPSLLSAVLLIPLVYLFASLLFGWQTGLLAALFMFLDPVTTITSQKLWMDTQLSFFIVASLFVFVYAAANKRNWAFVLSGFLGGCAVLTKYPGILAFVCIILSAAAYERSLFKNKYFLLSLSLPFLMLLPWAYWNYAVYGMDFFTQQASIHNFGVHARRTQILLVLMLLGVVVVVKKVIFNTHKSLPLQNSSSQEETSLLPRLRRKLVVILGLAFCVMNYKYFVYALDFTHFPITSWAQGTFADATSFFYFQKLIEWSFVYVFAFAAFFAHFDADEEGRLYLTLSSLVIMIFFIAWRSYQSRYILPAIPLLLILGVKFWMETFEKFSHSNNAFIRFTGRLILRVVLVFVAVKMYYINLALSYPNDMCYY